MRIFWNPLIRPSLRQEANVVAIDVINNEFQFLLENDKGEFLTAPCDECVRVDKDPFTKRNRL